jgi:hypothetical protein
VRVLLLAVVGAVLLALLAGPAASQALAAKGNASAAAGFLESAQNDDGGFGIKHGASSDPTASLWTATALLAAGKNPLDEFNKGGRSLDGYLVAHRSSYRTLAQLGVLALVQGGAGVADGHYGDPAGRLRSALTEAAVRADHRGAALAVLGLLAVGDEVSKQTAAATAQVLLASPLADGGWGEAGSSNSQSTALVLQALAKAGVADTSNSTVQAGTAYLTKAQGNDGSVAVSVRTDQGYNSGDVGATSFAIQAFAALGAGGPRTPTGKTLRDGLTQYQQQTSGGLSSAGSLYDTTFAPSVTETAQAFTAFNGDTLPLTPVPATTSGPPKATKKTTAGKRRPVSKHVSTGTAATGVSDTSSANAKDRGAFQQATAGRQAAGKKAKTDRAGSAGRKAKTTKTTKSATGTAAGGTSVTGQVVGATAAPKLATVAGQQPGGLSAQTKATIALLALLAVLLGAGGVLTARHPQAEDRPRTQVALIAATVLVRRARARGALAPLATVLVGLALIAVPLTTNMWQRAPQGAALIDAYRPYLQPAKVARYQRDLAQLNDGIQQAAAKGPGTLYPHLGATVAEKRFSKDGPMFASFHATWPKTYRSLRGVIDPIAAHRSGYEAIAALPRFGLFPWFFTVPGGVLVLLGLLALAWPRVWTVARFGVLAVGLGLVVAPAALHMWERAPKGAALVTAFTPVETRPAVVRVQNDFGRVAIAQGALAGEFVPALREHGLTTAQIDRRFGAVQTLTTRWIQILNDLTPVIGVMSDNVGRFQAVAALPPLTTFAWLFVIAGGLAALIAVISTARGIRRGRRQPAHAAPVADAGTAPAPVAAEPWSPAAQPPAVGASSTAHTP